jgi:ribonuclease HI
MNSYRLEFDGSCSKNPGGTCAFGFVIIRKDCVFACNTETIIKEGHGVYGTGPGMTNNCSEHIAVIKGLSAIMEFIESGDSLEIVGDSMLIINQLNGVWGARSNSGYYKFYHLSKRALKDIRQKGVTVTCRWIGRDQNQRADELSKFHNKNK